MAEVRRGLAPAAHAAFACPACPPVALTQAGYDSDDDEGGTLEHRKRRREMRATEEEAKRLTERARGRKHHIGDFIPPEELENFFEKVCIV